MHRKWGISYFMLVEEWFDLWCGSAVDAERLVVCGYRSTLSSERSVLKEDAWAWMLLLPVEG
jgi:hypothetical protein